MFYPGCCFLVVGVYNYHDSHPLWRYLELYERWQILDNSKLCENTFVWGQDSFLSLIFFFSSSLGSISITHYRFNTDNPSLMDLNSGLTWAIVVTLKPVLCIGSKSKGYYILYLLIIIGWWSQEHPSFTLLPTRLSVSCHGPGIVCKVCTFDSNWVSKEVHSYCPRRLRRESPSFLKDSVLNHPLR